MPDMQQPTAQQLSQQNMLARQVISQQGIEHTQSILSTTVDVASTRRVTVQPRNAGLLCGFIVRVSGQVKANAGGALTRTGFGSSNLVRELSFADFSNYRRIETSGYHLALLNSARSGLNYGGVYANSLPMGFGDNVGVFEGPATIVADATETVAHTYHVPIAYGDGDYRGAVYAATTGATMELVIDLNDNPVGNGTNLLDPVYTGASGGGYVGGVKVEVFQIFIDQLPRSANGGIILPNMDMNVAYDIKRTTFTGVTTGQDFPMDYANYRSYMSTFAIYDNGNTFNGGSDINSFSLTTANATNIWRVTPEIAALQARKYFLSDPPAGTYYFDHRKKPINTQEFGNMELAANVKSANANARFVLGYESMLQLSSVNVASSLGGG